MKSTNQASQSIVSAGLSPAASKILINNISAKTIAGGEGVNPEDLLTDFVTLFCVVLDETGSMEENRDTVIKAFDEMVAALKESKTAYSIIMSVWAFNDARTRLIHSYLPLDQVPSLVDYNPNNLTNLFDANLDAITSLITYEGDLTKAGTRTQSVFVSFTDGRDNTSQHSATDVKTVVDDLLKKEKYIFSLVAFGQDYAQQVAKEMGFPNQNVLEVGRSAHDIRLAMGTVSKSVIRASQTKIGGKGSQSGFFTS